ncbi:MAG: hypothetical protein ACYSU0_15855 [Planctomycetota bacterium]|jgi:hypothetical protein
MKLIAQSVVPPGLPYIHLGYLATTSTKPERPFLSAGLVLLVVGLGMAFKFTFGKTASGSSAVWMRWRKPVALTCAGLLVLAVGVAGVVLAYKRGEVVYDHPRSVTRGSMYSLAKHVSLNLATGKPVPQDPESIARELPADSRALHDGWFRPLLVKKDGADRYAVVSKGADGNLGTEDDMVRVVEAGKEVKY